MHKKLCKSFSEGSKLEESDGLYSTGCGSGINNKTCEDNNGILRCSSWHEASRSQREKEASILELLEAIVPQASTGSYKSSNITELTAEKNRVLIPLSLGSTNLFDCNTMTVGKTRNACGPYCIPNKCKKCKCLLEGNKKCKCKKLDAANNVFDFEFVPCRAWKDASVEFFADDNNPDTIICDKFNIASNRKYKEGNSMKIRNNTCIKSDNSSEIQVNRTKVKIEKTNESLIKIQSDSYIKSDSPSEIQVSHTNVKVEKTNEGSSIKIQSDSYIASDSSSEIRVSRTNVKTSEDNSDSRTHISYYNRNFACTCDNDNANPKNSKNKIEIRSEKSSGSLILTVDASTSCEFGCDNGPGLSIKPCLRPYEKVSEYENVAYCNTILIQDDSYSNQNYSNNSRRHEDVGEDFTCSRFPHLNRDYEKDYFNNKPNVEGIFPHSNRYCKEVDNFNKNPNKFAEPKTNNLEVRYVSGNIYVTNSTPNDQQNRNPMAVLRKTADSNKKQIAKSTSNNKATFVNGEDDISPQRTRNRTKPGKNQGNRKTKPKINQVPTKLSKNKILLEHPNKPVGKQVPNNSGPSKKKVVNNVVSNNSGPSNKSINKSYPEQREVPIISKPIPHFRHTPKIKIQSPPDVWEYSESAEEVNPSNISERSGKHCNSELVNTKYFLPVEYQEVELFETRFSDGKIDTLIGNILRPRMNFNAGPSNNIDYHPHQPIYDNNQVSPASREWRDNINTNGSVQPTNNRFYDSQIYQRSQGWRKQARAELQRNMNIMKTIQKEYEFPNGRKVLKTEITTELDDSDRQVGPGNVYGFDPNRPINRNERNHFDSGNTYQMPSTSRNQAYYDVGQAYGNVPDGRNLAYMDMPRRQQLYSNPYQDNTYPSRNVTNTLDVETGRKKK